MSDANHSHPLATSPQDYSTLWDLIKETRFGMFTHRHTDGMLHSHPLTTQNKSMDEGSVLYFFVPHSGEVAERVQSDPKVNVSYANPDKDSYVSLSGSAQIVDDQAKKEQLFNTAAKAWFPKGVSDPNLALLEVKIDHAEYWDVKESKMMQLAKMATAAVTGKPPKMGDHKTLDM